MTRTDYILVFSSLGGMVVFITAVVLTALKAKAYFDEQFSAHRKFIYNQLRKRDRAIFRLEFWAVRQATGYQPGADPLYAMYEPDTSNTASPETNGG